MRTFMVFTLTVFLGACGTKGGDSAPSVQSPNIKTLDAKADELVASGNTNLREKIEEMNTQLNDPRNSLLDLMNRVTDSQEQLDRLEPSSYKLYAANANGLDKEQITSLLGELNLAIDNATALDRAYKMFPSILRGTEARYLEMVKSRERECEGLQGELIESNLNRRYTELCKKSIENLVIANSILNEIDVDKNKELCAQQSELVVAACKFANKISQSRSQWKYYLGMQNDFRSNYLELRSRYYALLRRQNEAPN